MVLRVVYESLYALGSKTNMQVPARPRIFQPTGTAVHCVASYWHLQSKKFVILCPSLIDKLSTGTEWLLRWQLTTAHCYKSEPYRKGIISLQLSSINLWALCLYGPVSSVGFAAWVPGTQAFRCRLIEGNIIGLRVCALPVSSNGRCLSVGFAIDNGGFLHNRLFVTTVLWPGQDLPWTRSKCSLDCVVRNIIYVLPKKLPGWCRLHGVQMENWSVSVWMKAFYGSHWTTKAHTRNSNGRWWQTQLWQEYLLTWHGVCGIKAQSLANC